MVASNVKSQDGVLPWDS